MGHDEAGLAVFGQGPIERARGGGYRLRLTEDERRLLRSLAADLRTLLSAAPGDPSLRRLSPPAYEDDDESEAEYRGLVGGELDRGRDEALRLLAETAGRERLSAEELDAWLRALGDLRLVLGTRLGVTEETYEQELDPADPRAHELSLFVYLTWLQEQAVEAALDP